MLNIRYAKNTYGPKCENTHGPKLWLLDTWAWAHGPGSMGRRRWAAAAPPPLDPNLPRRRRPGGGGEPKLWPMSIFTFGPISIFSIPDF